MVCEDGSYFILKKILVYSVLRPFLFVLIVLHFAFCLYLHHEYPCPRQNIRTRNPSKRSAASHRLGLGSAPGFDPLAVQPARSESIYRLSYPGPIVSPLYRLIL